MELSSMSSTQCCKPGSTSSSRPQIEMSGDKKELVSSVLEGYDSDSLSQEDAIEIVSAFSDAGIAPSRDLANTMAASGFSAREVGELAGVAGASGMPPPPPGGGMPPPPKDVSQEIQAISGTLEVIFSNYKESDISEEQEELISSLLSGYDSSNLSQEDAMAITETLKDAGIKPSKQLAEVMSESGFSAREVGYLAQAERPHEVSQIISNYTDQIMSLTQDVKQDVRDLFESYRPANTELSAHDASTVVLNSLSQILSDSDNYKKSSYYA